MTVDYSDLIGVPFVSGGRSKEEGLDCYGLVLEVYKRNGIALPEYYTESYDSKIVSSIMLNSRDTSGFWQRLEVPEHLAIMGICFNCQAINHVGVYIGDGKFIHTRQRIGVNIDRVESPAWHRLIEGYYRYIGGDDR